ncbi:hypothetical protein INR49_005021 [Caranx melampygus]|nr:hypothetical protein INR49_005021 [Caranx melampygus]
MSSFGRALGVLRTGTQLLRHGPQRTMIRKVTSPGLMLLNGQTRSWESLQMMRNKVSRYHEEINGSLVWYFWI